MSINHLVSDAHPQIPYSNRIYSLLPEKVKNSFEFYSISTQTHTLHKIPNTSNPKIIIDYGDEWHSFPSCVDRKDVFLVIREFAPFDYYRSNKIIPLPSITDAEYSFPYPQQKKIKDRKYSFFSSMWLTPSRVPVKDILSQFESRDRFKIHWNQNYRTGFSLKEYKEMMYDSIITICPSGYLSPEIGKIQEALVCGNIIITSERPNYPFYENNTFFTYKNISDIPSIIENILSMDDEKLQSIVDRGNEYYNTKYSPFAMANVITKRLEELYSI